MKMSLRVLGTVLVLLGVLTAQAAPKPVRFIIKQPDAPIRIDSVETQYQKTTSYNQEGLRTTANFTSRAQQNITAFKLSFVMFGPFNNDLTAQGGVWMDDLGVGVSNEGVWVFSFYSDWSTVTTVAYVSAVRFEDGTVWTADEAEVARQIGDLVGTDFKPSALKEKQP